MILPPPEMSDISGGDKAYLWAKYRIFLPKMSYIFYGYISYVGKRLIFSVLMIGEKVLVNKKKKASNKV